MERLLQQTTLSQVTSCFVDDGIQDPMRKQNAEKYTLTKISKYILKVEVKDDIDWKLQLYFGRPIYPASHLSKIDGAEYLKKYDRVQLMGSNSYRISKKEYIEGKQIVLERVKDWWGYEYPWNKNKYNFDKIVYNIIRDENLIKENFKKGDLYTYDIDMNPSQWYSDFNQDNPKPSITSINK